MTIKDWLEGLSYKLVQGSLDVEVNEVVYGSRKAAPGAVFVCMKGTKIDSHDFIYQVTEAGVKVLVTEHPVEAPEGVTVVETENGREALALLSAARFGYPSRKLTMIGVTGTKGKTTTTHMIKTILETSGKKTGMIGTNGVYIGEEHFDECAEICRDIIGGVYGTYELDKTWYGPHCFDNNTSPEVIWTVPSENSKVEWNWYFKYFYHYSSYEYFGIETAGYNGFMLTPSLDPQGRYYTQWKLGNPYQKFNDKDLRKKPYRYLGSRKYEGMFLVGDQTNPNNPSQQCLGQKEYSGKVINLVDQVARFSEVGTKYNSVAELTSTMADGEENSGVRLVKAPQPNLDDKLLRWNPDCPVIRLSEIYYMLAECELRAGDKKTAAGLINQVRGRNFEGGADPNPVTADNLDEYRMLDEWMIEFLGEGRRRTDLIRWDKFVTESWWDHTPLNDKNKNLFPIPNSAISANNLIEQNPGY